jgi:hypothetical protein
MVNPALVKYKGGALVHNPINLSNITANVSKIYFWKVSGMCRPEWGRLCSFGQYISF